MLCQILKFVHKYIPDYENVIKKAKKVIDEYGGKIIYPTDVALNDNGQRVGITIDQLPANHPIHDIGLDTLVKYINFLGLSEMPIKEKVK